MFKKTETYHRVSCLCWCNYFWLAHQRCQTSLDRKFLAIKSQYIRSQLPKRISFFSVPTVVHHFDCMDNTVVVLMMVIAVKHCFLLPFRCDLLIALCLFWFVFFVAYSNKFSLIELRLCFFESRYFSTRNLLAFLFNSFAFYRIFVLLLSTACNKWCENDDIPRREFNIL